MIDPDNITKFHRKRSELEEVLIFWVCVAGKTAATIAPAVERLMKHLANNRRAPRHEPFALLRRAGSQENLQRLLKDHGIGCHGIKSKMLWRLAHGNLDLRTCSADDLKCGRKTSRCFIIHSRADAKHAGLDTHVMKALRRRGFSDAPPATPSSDKQYDYWEKIVVGLTREEGKTVAAWDLDEWKIGRDEAKGQGETKMFTMKLVSDLWTELMSGAKQCTIRAGRRDVPLGPMRFEETNGTRAACVNVTDVRHKLLRELTDEEARVDGAKDAPEMKNALRQFYPDLTEDSEITLVFWDELPISA
jgi:hypothetical protein